MLTNPAVLARSSTYQPTYDRVPGPDRAQRLVRAFEAAQRDDGPGCQAELRAATFGFIDALRTAQLPPEQAVIMLKTVLSSTDGEPVSFYAANQLTNVSPRHRAYRSVFAWSLDAYYSSAPAARLAAAR